MKEYYTYLATQAVRKVPTKTIGKAKMINCQKEA
jgi:hypothetical protein